MSNISNSDAELLKYALDNGIIDKELVQKTVEMQKRKELLDKHQYKIYQGKDGYWYTYLPDKEKGRIKKKASSKIKIEGKVIEYWENQEINPTVEEIFAEWIEKKLSYEEISRATYDRYTIDFNRYFCEIKSKRIKEINELCLEEFVKKSIVKYSMTSKRFSNFRTLLYGIFKYAKKKRFVQFSIVNTICDMDISQKAFRKNVKKAESQIYNIEEKDLVEGYLMEHLDIVNLGLLLAFKTGVRIGELATLKREEVENYTIPINRTETRYKDDDGKTVYGVKESPKSDAGMRFAILPDRYKWILDDIITQNPNGEYLFEKNGNRIKTYSFRRRLRYVCEAKLHIESKSPHKIRKTFGTILLDNNVKESTILETMGHTDISCTKGHYYYNRGGVEDKRRELNEVQGL